MKKLLRHTSFMADYFECIHRESVPEPLIMVTLAFVTLPKLRLKTSLQRLPSRRTLRIQVWFLPQPNSPMPRSLPQTLIIRRCRMVYTPIIPNRQIILVNPPMAHLQIMVLNNQSHKPFQKRFALQRRQIIDLLHMVSDGENGFPARHRIRAHDRMYGDEVFAHIVGRATGVGVELECIGGGGFVELGLRISRGEAFKEALVRLRDAIVELVARCP